MSAIEMGVDQLIERVRSEALEKAQADRDVIIKAAEHRAQALVEEAQLQAQTIIAEALLVREKEQRDMAVELEHSARDFTLKLFERLQAQMIFPIVREKIRATVQEPDFLKEALTRLLVGYVNGNASSLDVLVSKELKTTLAAFLASAVFDALDVDSAIHLIDEAGMEGFALRKRGENFVWDFRIDTIAEELMRLVEPQMRKYFVASTNMTAIDLASSYAA